MVIRMDYYEFIENDSRDNIKEILDCFYSIVDTLQQLSEFRYEILIRLLIDKRIIDSEEEIIQFTRYKNYSASSIVESCLPKYLDDDTEDRRLSYYERKIDEYKDSLNTNLESELEAMFNRFRELEKRNSFSEQEKNDE